MHVEEAIRTRRATRAYTDQPISDDVLDTVVNLTLEAPSAFNAQRADLVVVRDQDVKDGLFAASGQKQLRDAPVVLVTVARSEAPEDLDEIMGADRGNFVRGWLDKLDAQQRRESALKDAMLLAGFALIAAQSQGLSSSPTTGWDEKKVLEAIGLGGRDDRGVGLVIALGYPDEQPQHPGRQPNRRVDNHYDA